jgi:hypothetical protein
MKSHGKWAIALLALGACGGPTMTEEDSGTEVDSGTSLDAGAIDSGTNRDSGSTGAIAPIIRTVTWTHGSPCDNHNRPLTITTTVEDPDTPSSSLVFSGYVGGCTGMLDAATSTVSCNGTSPTIAFIHVEDEGMRADDQAVNIGYCVDGSQTF